MKMARFAGYAAIFDRPDSGGDVIRKGAFARAKKSGLPLLRQHDARLRIGTVELLEEDARGLRIIAQVEAAEAVAPGAGLSFGYRVRRSSTGTYRELIDLEIAEVSLVNHPMQKLARVLAVEEGDDDGL